MPYISREHQLRVGGGERMMAQKNVILVQKPTRAALRSACLQCSCEYTVTLAVRFASCNIRLYGAHSKETESCIQLDSDESKCLRVFER